MKSPPGSLVGLSLLALAACGGGSKAADTTPADEPLEATPVATETDPGAADTEASGAADAADANAAGGDGSVCDQFCSAVLTCAAQGASEPPTDDEKNQFNKACLARCGEGTEEEIAKAQACVTENQDNCPGLFECLKQADAPE